MKNYKALLYIGRTDTQAYKHNLFMVTGVVMMGGKKVYLPNPKEHTIKELKKATENLVKVRTDGHGVVEWLEVKSYEQFKKEWKNITGSEFK